MLHNLERGCAPSSLVGSMVEQKFEPQIARALVEAFMRARAAGGALPEGSIAVDLPEPEYIYEPPRLEAGSVRVLARMDRPVIAVLGAVLSAEECEEIVALARPRLA